MIKMITRFPRKSHVHFFQHVISLRYSLSRLFFYLLYLLFFICHSPSAKSESHLAWLFLFLYFFILPFRDTKKKRIYSVCKLSWVDCDCDCVNTKKWNILFVSVFGLKKQWLAVSTGNIRLPVYFWLTAEKTGSAWHTAAKVLTVGQSSRREWKLN